MPSHCEHKKVTSELGRYFGLLIKIVITGIISIAAYDQFFR